MSLLSSFIAKHIVSALEAQFLSHVPELQEAFLKEMANLVKVMSDWIESKMQPTGESSDEEKGS